MIQHTHVAARNGAERKFFMAGHAQLTHDEDIQGRIERTRYFESNGHAAARQSEHNDIAAALITAQLFCEIAAGLKAVPKRKSHASSPVARRMPL
jgi:hypothetical protein